MTTRVLVVELSQGEPGKPFEGLTSGSFRDMYGRPVVITHEDLAAYVQNTQALIETTKDENNEIVGLPIDAQNHDQGDAGGWIVGVSLEGKKIKFTPRWTEIGAEKIRKGIMRLFSATLDTVKKVILGGTLTNWPAVRGLRPISLSEMPEMHQFMLDSESLDEASRRVRMGFMEWHATAHGDRMCCYPQDVYDEYLVVSNRGKLMRVPYSEDDKGGVEIGAEDTWKRVRMIPVEMSEALEHLLKPIRDLFDQARPATPTTPQEVEMDEAQLKAMLEANNESVLAKVAELIADKTAQPVPPTTPAESLVDLSDARAALTSQMEEVLRKEAEKLTADAGRMLGSMLAQMSEKQKVTQLAADLTQGKLGANGWSLPMQADRIEAFLNSLNLAQRKQAEELFIEIVKTGLVEFAEAGSSGAGKARLLELPEHIVADLNSGKITLAHLRSPVMAEALEKPLDAYDLTRWEKHD